MTRQELHELSKQIDKLDTLIGLNDMTITDVRNKINKAYQIAKN
jgi:hypothetical protein